MSFLHLIESHSNKQSEETQSKSEDVCFVEDKLRDMLCSLLEELPEDEVKKTFIQFLPRTKTNSRFSQIFDIVPHEGCLEPDEYIIVYFRFKPEDNTEVTATVNCHIVGGANEPIVLTGKSRKISYFLKDNLVDLGKLYFYEAGENQAALVNDGEGKFTFTVSEAVLPSGWLIIEPASATVPPSETFPLTLKCFPGTVGRFETSFRVEVDYLEPASVTVWGFGVYPQIYFSLPRPDLDKIDPFITYSAIAELENVSHNCECADDYFPNTDRFILEDDGWVVISLTEDNFPCTMEIELSIERIWAKFLLQKDKVILHKLVSGEKFWPIPNFIVSPYVFDMGCIKINTKTLYTLNYVNYGPGRTILRTTSSHTFSKHGFDFHFVKQAIEKNRVSEIHFSFHPTVEKFQELNTKITEFLFVDLRNGPRIPIQLEVLVATPTVEVSDNEVDFGSIRCGDCLRKSINLFNK